MITNINQIKVEVNILPNRIYHMGHSSSPKTVLVTGVSGGRVSYVNYPYYGKKVLIEQENIMSWLIVPGTKTRLSQIEGYSKIIGSNELINKEVEDHKKFLSGENVYEEQNIEDWERLDVEVKPSPKFEEIRSEVRNNDYWYYGEQYGCMGGFVGEREGEYIINGITRKSLKKLESEGYSVILKVEKDKVEY